MYNIILLLFATIPASASAFWVDDTQPRNKLIRQLHMIKVQVMQLRSQVDMIDLVHLDIIELAYRKVKYTV